MKKEWHTPKLTTFTQANDDYEALNNILIAQAGEMEILIAGQQERIRDLEAEVRDLQAAIVDKDAKITELLKVTPYRREWE